MQIRIDDIVLRKRIRKDMGDLALLMESLKKYGLMNPIVINRNNELIAGHRRLESAKRLGWKVIEVIVLDRQDGIDQLEMEIEENIQRKSLTTDELSEGYLRLDKMKNPGLLTRIWRAIANFFRNLFNLKSKR
jgi:ParB family transcriptional regulator, chromosome partitioning protein